MDFLGIFLNKDSPLPLYSQLYHQLAGQIRTGTLPAGEKLPGKRPAAAALGVSVNTVDEAYQMLAAEGYVNAVPRSGFVICRLEQSIPPPATPPALGSAPPATVPGAQGWLYSFSSGDLDEDLFPKKTWTRLLREVLTSQDGLFARGESMGDAVLHEAIAEYLRGYRGVQCQPEQIAVGAGLEVLTGMLARLLEGRCFALENPGYPKTAQILANTGLHMAWVPVDGLGMQPEALAASGAQVAYITPSHQFPTGGVMPAPRRSELLRWAHAGQHFIIEDDYDSEFRFSGRPLPSMQGLDGAGRVVYAGTFSRSLAPGLRAAYLVLPQALLARWRAAYSGYACTVSRPEQHTLACLMREGHFARSLNRMRGVYRRRRDLLLVELHRQFPAGRWHTQNEHTGLYFILRLPGQNAVQLAEQARGLRLHLRALAEYAVAPPAPQDTEALVLGYGGLAEQQIPEAVAALRRVLFT